jgi:nitrate/TMAO reductase-like tetraheme cytochrome c subunit
MKLPKSYYNLISYFGTAMAVFFFFLIILMLVLQFFFDFGNQYSSLFTFIILPIFLVIGLILISLGMFLKNRRDKKSGGSDQNRFTVIDINKPEHFNWFLIVLASTAVILGFSAVGTYEAFHYSESVEFCGTVCHEVMEPEYVTYQHSSHARITCAECHIGAGADWFVKSKISGLYQVYSVLAKKYPTPIPTPIENLRPARETCEKCHWPQKFYDNKLKNKRYFMADEENSEWLIELQMKTSPAHSALGQTEGSHWHVNPNVQIEYASDERREIISWVKYTDKATGKVVEYFDEENAIEESDLAGMEKRTMDCLDCHNRPSHSYKFPQDYVDDLIVSGEVDRSIPSIKFAAMEVLKYPYETREEGLKTLNDQITDFFKTEKPDYYEANKDKISKAIASIQREYSHNSFPKMKAEASYYMNHSSHLESNGCFRCHNGTFKSTSGRVITKDCNSCHVILAQGKPNALQFASNMQTLEFVHPTEIKGKWKTFNCSECHAALFE